MPHSQTMRFNELRFFKIGSSVRAPSSALPIGEALPARPMLAGKWQDLEDFEQASTAYYSRSLEDKLAIQEQAWLAPKSTHQSSGS